MAGWKGGSTLGGPTETMTRISLDSTDEDEALTDEAEDTTDEDEDLTDEYDDDLDEDSDDYRDSDDNYSQSDVYAPDTGARRGRGAKTSLRRPLLGRGVSRPADAVVGLRSLCPSLISKDTR